MKFIFFGFIIAYNPIYIYYLMSHGALGGITLRLAMGSVFLFSIIYLSFIVLFVKKNMKIKISKTPLFVLINILFIFFILGVTVGFVKGNNLKYLLLDVFPMLEMFIVYYVIKLSPIIQDNFDFGKLIKWFMLYLFLMSITGFISYVVLSFIKPVFFGALRAYISGITVNRMMDFIIPLFLPAILFFYKYIKKKYWAIILTITSAIVVLLTFYRTIYVAVFIGILYLLLINRSKIFRIFGTFIKISILILLVLILLQKSNYFRYANANLYYLIKSRIVSIYAPDKKIDISAAARISHNKEMLYNIFNNFPYIAGMGGEYQSSEGAKIPYNFTSNYFLQVISLLGMPAGLLFILIYLRTFFLSHEFAKNAQDLTSRIFFNACASILVTLFVILNIFPYMNYFPLLYLFGWICGIMDRYGIYLKQKTL